MTPTEAEMDKDCDEIKRLFQLWLSAQLNGCSILSPTSGELGDVSQLGPQLGVSVSLWGEDVARETRCGRNSDLQIGHGHAIQHVVAGLLNGTEQVVERSNVDAWLLVCSQHGVGLPATWKQQHEKHIHRFAFSETQLVWLFLQGCDRYCCFPGSSFFQVSVYKNFTFPTRFWDFLIL